MIYERFGCWRRRRQTRRLRARLIEWIDFVQKAGLESGDFATPEAHAAFARYVGRIRELADSNLLWHDRPYPRVVIRAGLVDAE